MLSRPRFMITHLAVRNYRSLADISLELSPLTVLVGPNGAGKSNIVDVLRFLSDILKLGLDSAIANRGGIGAIRRWSPKGRPYNVAIEITVEGEEGWKGSFSLEIGGERGGEYFIRREKCEVLSDDGKGNSYEIRDGQWVIHPNLGALQGAPGVTDEHLQQLQQISRTRLFLPQAFSPEFLMLGFVLRRVGIYHVPPETIRQPQKPANPQPLLEDGSNLSSTLRYLKQEKKENLRKILEVMGRINEGIADLSVSLVGGYLVTRLHYGKGGPAFPLAQESDGTLRVLGLLTALYQEPPCTLIAMEEPELNIHPGALAVLRDVFLEASQNTQILLTTHSPDLLEGIPPESLRVVEREEGVTKVGPVAPHQMEVIRKKLFHPGEIMRIIGLTRAEEPVAV